MGGSAGLRAPLGSGAAGRPPDDRRRDELGNDDRSGCPGEMDARLRGRWSWLGGPDD